MACFIEHAAMKQQICRLSELDIKVERLPSLVVLRQVLIKFSMTSHKSLGLDAKILDFHN